MRTDPRKQCNNTELSAPTVQQATSLSSLSLVLGISIADACVSMLAGCLSDYPVQSSPNGTSQTKPGDRLTGRYYQASGPAAVQAAAAAASNAAEAKNAHVTERAGRLAELEQKVAADPGNEELWLLFALQHIDLGAVESMQGEAGLFRKAQLLLVVLYR